MENSPVTGTPESELANTAPTVNPTPAEPSVEVLSTPAAVTEEVKSSKLPLIGAIVASLLILGGAGYYVYENYYVNGGVVAVVNGKNIHKKALDESVALVEQNPALYGIDPKAEDATTQIQTQAMEVLVTNALLITAAEKGGYTVTDEDVENTFGELVTQLGSAEELQKQMATVGLTEDKLRSNIRERELVDQYLAAETDLENITVTDADVEEFVNMLTSQNIEIPPLEEIRPQIEAEIKTQKQQELINGVIVRLREEATIEMKL
jgi:hypothetical protein